MSKAKLKKHLMMLPKERIVNIVLELYDARKEAKEFLDFYLEPNEDKKLEEYKAIIREEFFPKRRIEPQCRFTVCRKAISDFKKLKPHPMCIADLMLYYIECGVEMTVMYGDMWEQFYTALENNFDKAMAYICQNGYGEPFRERIERMLHEAEHCGWGFPDTLWDMYYEHMQSNGYDVDIS
ncbi:MAG: hypothetical protein IJK42_15900 [Prevotella sp.]|nr:hypothetical protein [Prevotella sp.]MBQ6211229.1 hypothetical protein [Prevotella sp.]